MKIAKKVLALLMAVAMIAALSAMAFADEPAIELKKGEIAADGTFTLSVIVKDAALATCDWVLKYDETALEIVDGEDGVYFADGLSKALAKGKIMGAFNVNTAGTILLGITLTSTLKEDAGSAFVDGEGCEFLCVDFKLKNADAKNVNIALSEKDAAEGAIIVGTVVNEEVVVEETTTAAPVVEETTTAPADTAMPETTTAAATDNVNPKGDTGSLAIVAGVVALAGAAFVVSKKKR